MEAWAFPMMARAAGSCSTKSVRQGSTALRYRRLNTAGLGASLVIETLANGDMSVSQFAREAVTNNASKYIRGEAHDRRIRASTGTLISPCCNLRLSDCCHLVGATKASYRRSLCDSYC